MEKTKKMRQEIYKKRKNFFPTLIITVLLWLLTFGLIYFIEPETFGVVPLLFVLLFFSLLFTFSTIFANTRRGLLISLALVSFLILRFFGIGNILNLLLILAIILTIEIYFFKKGS